MTAMLPEGTTVFADADAVARAAAERLIGATAGPGPASVCLSGGSTPKALYGLLASDAYRGRVAWDRIHWWWGDERFVPPTDARSNEAMVRAAMLDHVPVPAALVHPMPTGVLGDDALEPAAAAYGRALRAFAATRAAAGRPLFDLVLLGLGDDGHTASMFPGKPAVLETHHWAMPVPDAGLAPFVPRLTLTLPALADSAGVLFLAVGAGKRPLLGRVAAGEALPAGQVRSAGGVTWYVDRAAAGAATP